MENTTNLSLPKEKLERGPVKTVILASMMGTAIEFFDFYAYGTASAAYFPSVFFPQTTPLLATLLSLLTFGVAFVARPFGSFLFGHFGDRLGRKKTLVVSLLVMGVATVSIGFIPGQHRRLGRAAALPLPLRSRHRSWRRMVRRCFGRNRKRAGRQAGFVRSLS